MIHTLFQARIDALLAGAPDERRQDAWLAVQRAISGAPKTEDKAALGRYMGPLLKAIEREYLPADDGARGKLEKIEELHRAGIITEQQRRDLVAALGQRGIGKAVEGAHGALRADDSINAYNMIEGLFFERSRADVARRLGIASTTAPRPPDPVRVSFVGLHTGRPARLHNVLVDNDVPVVAQHLWETKRYTRMDYGQGMEANETVSGHCANQLLKYQAAITAGAFTGATLEIYGNIAPDFLRALIDLAPVAPGLFLDIPDVEVLYALDAETSIPLRRSRAPVSVARGVSSTVARPYIHALALKRYDLFSGRLLTAEDVAGDAELTAAIAGGTVDPLRIRDLAAFRRFEALVAEKRKKLIMALDTSSAMT